MQFAVPKYAEEINGKWWTPKMVMHYRGYTRAVFEKLRKEYTLKQILYGDSIQQNVKHKRFVDRSSEIKIAGRKYTIAMIYYYMASRGHIDPDTRSYSQFSALCRSYKQKYTGDLAGAVDLVCMNVGCNISSSLKSLTDAQYDALCSKYGDYITNSKKKSAVWSGVDPNDRYMECLAKDRQLYWLYCDGVIKDYERIKKENQRYKEINSALADQIVSLRDEKSKLEQELFYARVRTA